MTATAGGRAGAWLRRGGRAVVAVLPQWLTARVVVLGALAVAHRLATETHPNPATVARVHQGLLGWDAGWYQAIAAHGYHPYGDQALRFFPLVPLAARALAVLPGVSVGAGLLILANGGALVATALLVVLVRRETGDDALARRSAWLLSLVPPAFVLVMGYAEAVLLVFSLWCFLAIRRSARGSTGQPGGQAGGAAGSVGGWCSAAVAGVLAGLTRPLGVLLVVPVAVEAVRRWPAARHDERASSLVAVAAPVAGLVIYLAWARAAFGSFWEPLRVQTQSGHHGGLRNPVSTLLHDARGVLHHHLGTALHVPWVLLVVALVVVCWFRLPASYAAFSTAVVAVALSGTNLDSFERYALSAFPLVIAGSLLTASARVERVVLTLASAGLFAYALLAFTNVLVP